MIVTAAHVLRDIGTSIPSKTEFTVKLESGETSTALLLKEYSGLFTEEMHSETFCNEYSYGHQAMQRFPYSLHLSKKRLHSMKLMSALV